VKEIILFHWRALIVYTRKCSGFIRILKFLPPLIFPVFREGRQGVPHGDRQIETYSPHLNLAETLWRILKGKRIKPQDYVSKNNLFFAANRALANVGKVLYVNFKNHAA
jgi:hypothetical protein